MAKTKILFYWLSQIIYKLCLHRILRKHIDNSLDFFLFVPKFAWQTLWEVMSFPESQQEQGP